nr:7086_t:CDS:2 [Entrophospora candida]
MEYTIQSCNDYVSRGGNNQEENEEDYEEDNQEENGEKDEIQGLKHYNIRRFIRNPNEPTPGSSWGVIDNITKFIFPGDIYCIPTKNRIGLDHQKKLYQEAVGIPHSPHGHTFQWRAHPSW